MHAGSANIGVQGQRVRLRFGAVMFATGLVLAIGLVLSDVAHAWRLAVFLPFVLGATGVFQARART